MNVGTEKILEHLCTPAWPDITFATGYMSRSIANPTEMP